MRELATDRLLPWRVGRAERWWQRARGLLGRQCLQDDEGLLLVPCRAVHMFGMQFPIDIAWIARDGRVLAVQGLAPGSRPASNRDAHAVLELPAGALARAGVLPGSVLHWEEVA